MLVIHPKVEVLRNHYHLWMIMHLPKLDVLYGPILDESEVIQNWMFCTIHFGMILNTLANHPKVEVFYNPLLDDSDYV